MPYANFRKFVFCVPTACTLVSRTNPNIQCVVCGWDPGDYPGPDVLGTEITGHLATAVTNADMRKRLTWLLVAIEHTIAADRRNTPTPPGDTLRIFVVPEFYFRTTWQEQARGRDYTKEEFAELTGALSFYFDSYSRIHRCAPLRDWLFLCGSCVHREPFFGWGSLVNEMVRVYIDGEACRSIKTIQKMCTSPIDGIYPVEDWNAMAAAVQFVDPVRRNHHYMHAQGVYVEICLEHRTFLAASSRYLPGVRVNVLSAAGMPFGDGEALAPSRWYLRADGMLQSSPLFMVDSFMTDAFGRIPPNRRSVAVVGAVCSFHTWRNFDPATMGFPGFQLVGRADFVPVVFVML